MSSERNPTANRNELSSPLIHLCYTKSIIERHGTTITNDIIACLKHVQNYRSTNKNTQEKSALRIHAKNEHQDKKVEYKMEVLQAFKKPLQWQCISKASHGVYSYH